MPIRGWVSSWSDPQPYPRLVHFGCVVRLHMRWMLCNSKGLPEDSCLERSILRIYVATYTLNLDRGESCELEQRDLSNAILISYSYQPHNF